MAFALGNSKQVNMVEDAKANPTVGVLSSGQFISTNNNNVVLFIDKIKDNQIRNVYLFQMTPQNKQNLQ